MVRSKFSGLAYLIFFITLLFLVVAPVIFLLFIPLEKSTRAFIVLPIVGIVMFLILIPGIYLVSIEADSILIRSVFKRKLILPEHIHLIDLFAKDSPSLSSDEMIAIKIKLEDGKRILIWDLYYRNVPVLKQTLIDHFEKKIKPYKRIKHHKTFNITDQETITFSGNFFFSINFLMLLIIGGGVITGIISMSPGMPLLKQLPLYAIFLLLLWFIGTESNYFELMNQNLIIKNHIFFWKKKVYNIDDIIEANTERWHRRAIALRITTFDFKSKRHGAGSLRSDTWKRLKETLKKNDIYFPE